MPRTLTWRNVDAPRFDLRQYGDASQMMLGGFDRLAQLFNNRGQMLEDRATDQAIANDLAITDYDTLRAQLAQGAAGLDPNANARAVMEARALGVDRLMNQQMTEHNLLDREAQVAAAPLVARVRELGFSGDQEGVAQALAQAQEDPILARALGDVASAAYGELGTHRTHDQNVQEFRYRQENDARNHALAQRRVAISEADLAFRQNQQLRSEQAAMGASQYGTRLARAVAPSYAATGRDSENAAPGAGLDRAIAELYADETYQNLPPAQKKIAEDSFRQAYTGNSIIRPGTQMAFDELTSSDGGPSASEISQMLSQRAEAAAAGSDYASPVYQSLRRLDELGSVTATEAFEAFQNITGGSRREFDRLTAEGYDPNHIMAAVDSMTKSGFLSWMMPGAGSRFYERLEGIKEAQERLGRDPEETLNQALRRPYEQLQNDYLRVEQGIQLKMQEEGRNYMTPNELQRWRNARNRALEAVTEFENEDPESTGSFEGSRTGSQHPDSVIPSGLQSSINQVSDRVSNHFRVNPEDPIAEVARPVAEVARAVVPQFANDVGRTLNPGQYALSAAGRELLNEENMPSGFRASMTQLNRRLGRETGDDTPPPSQPSQGPVISPDSEAPDPLNRAGSPSERTSANRQRIEERNRDPRFNPSQGQTLLDTLGESNTGAINGARSVSRNLDQYEDRLHVALQRARDRAERASIYAEDPEFVNEAQRIEQEIQRELERIGRPNYG